ncbi:hypothetical protein GOP47_0018371 [Adiantum capillus-veneris]|uniref:MalT-like TPR region domain-containing protein n=1 Tax=Adiantum capillus-veneris TaxID=13818 RepID=A0A9D4UH54_ADICA|nr:hypothetical protein GOP47_0018371 [Adiantum capillus-veneris]
MRFIAHQRRRSLFSSMRFVRGGAVREGCVAKSPTQNMGSVPCFSFNNDMELPLTEDSKHMHDFLYKQVSSSCSRLISLQCLKAHSGSMGCHFYSDRYSHASCWRQCRDLCTVTSQETSDLKPEVGCVDASQAAWDTLTSQMKDLKDGLAKGKVLKSLKGLVDQLEPFAEAIDLRLGLARLRLAQSLAAAGEEPGMYLGYAQRALKCLEALVKGSWEHGLCLFILGSAYVELGKFDSAVLQLDQCVSVLKQMKGTSRDGRYDIFVVSVHHILGQLESLRGQYHKSLMHFEHAIRIGKKALKEGSPKLPTLYYKAGTACRNASDPKVAMSFALKALEGYMTCYGPSSLQVGRVRALMSGIHCDLQKYEDALLEYNEAKPILEYLKETEEMARMNLDMAKLLSYEKKSGAALPLLEQVINSTEVSSLYHFTALIRAAMASSELKLEDAADYFRKAVDAVDHQEISRSTALYLVQLGSIAEKRKDFEHAAMLFQKAMKMLDECLACSPQSVLVEDKAGQLQFFDKVGLLQLRDKVGMLLLRAGKVKKAIPYFQSSLKDAESGNGVQLLIAHVKLGSAYSLLNKKSEASKHFKACNEMCTEWIQLLLTYKFYSFAITNRSIDHLGALENLGICMLWFFV